MTEITSSDPIEASYEDLRRLASSYLAKQGSGHTLQPTALVHEAWLRYADQLAEPPAAGKHPLTRSHVLARAACAMRHVLIDHARQRQAIKRGGDRNRVTLSEAAISSGTTAALESLAPEQATADLGATEPELARLAELRLFGGLTIEASATALEWPLSTTKKRWQYTLAWLSRALAEQA